MRAHRVIGGNGELAGLHGAHGRVALAQNPARGQQMMSIGRRPVSRPKGYWVFLTALCAAVLFSQESYAQRSGSSDRLNENTLTVVSSSPNGTYMPIAYDMSAVLDDGDNLRVLVVLGKGGGQNIKDVRFLKGVDLGIAASNTLGYYRRTGELGNIDDKIVYIAKLYNEEIHFIARPEITSIEQLRGKKVNFNFVNSGTQLSARDVFDRLGIKVEETNYGTADAFERMKTGEIAASVLASGKPAPAISAVKATDGFHFLQVPLSKALINDYLPTTLTHEDYPGLLAPGQTAETIAAGVALIAYNWPKNTDRYRRIAKFVDAFFPRLADFQKPPRHPKWREANLAAVLPGWKRFEGAEEWLRAHAPVAQGERGKFDQFLAAKQTQPVSLPQDERDRLFQEFLQWTKTRERR
jgi:TRAP transporter TAXI family solute receptor